MCSPTHTMNTPVHHDGNNEDNASDFECIIIVIPYRCFVFIRWVPHLNSMLIRGLIYAVSLFAFAFHSCSCWTKQIMCPIKFLTLQTDFVRNPWNLSAHSPKGCVSITSKPKCFMPQNVLHPSTQLCHDNTNGRCHRLRLCVMQRIANDID